MDDFDFNSKFMPTEEVYEETKRHFKHLSPLTKSLYKLSCKENPLLSGDYMPSMEEAFKYYKTHPNSGKGLMVKGEAKVKLREIFNYIDAYIYKSNPSYLQDLEFLAEESAIVPAFLELKGAIDSLRSAWWLVAIIEREGLEATLNIYKTLVEFIATAHFNLNNEENSFVGDYDEVVRQTIDYYRYAD